MDVICNGLSVEMERQQSGASFVQRPEAGATGHSKDMDYASDSLPV